MSQENVEVARRGYEHFSASGDMLAEMLDPDFVWDMSTFRGWPERQEYPGIEGARRFNAEWADAWDDWEVVVEDYVDAGEQVVVLVRQRGRSKASGVPVDMRLGQVWTFEGEQAVRMEMYASHEEALDAAGVSE